MKTPRLLLLCARGPHHHTCTGRGVQFAVTGGLLPATLKGVLEGDDGGAPSPVPALRALLADVAAGVAAGATARDATGGGGDDGGDMM